jgi:NarL family two-component system response regulator LiaR
VTSNVQQFDSTPISATRVLVADPNSSVRASLRAFVESEPGLEFVGDVDDSQWLLWAFRVAEPDVLVVDAALPGGCLVSIMECVRTRRPDMRIVMLGNGPQHESTARRAGADTFVLKVETPDVLRQALRPLADRQN